MMRGEPSKHSNLGNFITPGQHQIQENTWCFLSFLHYEMKNVLFIVLVIILGASEAARNCINGAIANDTCICFPGWMGESCDRCGGRIR